jgi:hypothetical protein
MITIYRQRSESLKRRPWQRQVYILAQTLMEPSWSYSALLGSAKSTEYAMSSMEVAPNILLHSHHEVRGVRSHRRDFDYEVGGRERKNNAAAIQ